MEVAQSIKDSRSILCSDYCLCYLTLEACHSCRWLLCIAPSYECWWGSVFTRQYLRVTTMGYFIPTPIGSTAALNSSCSNERARYHQRGAQRRTRQITKCQLGYNLTRMVWDCGRRPTPAQGHNSTQKGLTTNPGFEPGSVSPPHHRAA